MIEDLDKIDDDPDLIVNTLACLLSLSGEEY